MSVFFSGFMGVWIVARNKQITREPLRGARDLFVRATIHTPMNPEKRHSFLNWINNMDHMRISGTEPSSVILSQTKKFQKLESVVPKRLNKLKPKGMV